MKIKCINNDQITSLLTENKIYEVVDEDEDFYCVIDESGYENGFFKKRFEILKENNMIKFIKEFDNETEVKISLEYNSDGDVYIVATNNSGFNQAILKISKEGIVEKINFTNKFGFSIDIYNKIIVK